MVLTLSNSPRYPNIIHTCNSVYYIVQADDGSEQLREVYKDLEVIDSPVNSDSVVLPSDNRGMCISVVNCECECSVVCE